MSRPRHPLGRKSLIRPDPIEELARFKQALTDARQQRLAREAEQRAQAAQLDHERQLFSRSVGTVQPLRRQPTPPLPREPAQPIPRQRERDEAAVLHEAISDEFDVETLLDTDDTLSYRRADIGVAVLRKLRRGVWAIQAELDLHGLRRDQARDALSAFMRRAVQMRLRCVRVVHGKGNGSPGREPVLKAKVKSWLVQRIDVIAFVQARPTEGGHGALVVLLSPGAVRMPASRQAIAKS